MKPTCGCTKSVLIVPRCQIHEFLELMWLNGPSLPLLGYHLECHGKQTQTLLHQSKFCSFGWLPLCIPGKMFELILTLRRSHLYWLKRKLNLHLQQKCQMLCIDMFLINFLLYKLMSKFPTLMQEFFGDFQYLKSCPWQLFEKIILFFYGQKANQ